MPPSCRFTTPRDGASRQLRLLPQPSLHHRIRQSLRECAIHRRDGGELWQAVAVQGVRSILDSGVSRFKNYVYLLHRESSRGSFLPLNLDEKVILLENFYQEYVVITLQAIDRDSADTKHIHSIVVKIGQGVVAFDINGLLDTLTGTSMEELRPKLESKHVPWTYTSTKSAFRKISSIYRTMSRYAA